MCSSSSSLIPPLPARAAATAAPASLSSSLLSYDATLMFSTLGLACPLLGTERMSDKERCFRMGLTVSCGLRDDDPLFRRADLPPLMALLATVFEPLFGDVCDVARPSRSSAVAALRIGTGSTAVWSGPYSHVTSESLSL
jgi:hypothetical protein